MEHLHIIFFYNLKLLHQYHHNILQYLYIPNRLFLCLYILNIKQALKHILCHQLCTHLKINHSPYQYLIQLEHLCILRPYNIIYKFLNYQYKVHQLLSILYNQQIYYIMSIELIYQYIPFHQLSNHSCIVSILNHCSKFKVHPNK